MSWLIAGGRSSKPTTVLRSDAICAPPFDKEPYRAGVAYALVDAMVRLANVDYQAVGLEGCVGCCRHSVNCVVSEEVLQHL